MPSPARTAALIRDVLSGDSGLATIEDMSGLDSGTVTSASNAATLNTLSGVITTASKTTAAAGTYKITLTNSKIKATSKVFVSVALNASGAGTPVVTSVTPASGSVVIIVQNIHASAAFDGAHKLSFLVV